MVELITTNNGSFPRIGERKDEQVLRRAYSDIDTGKIGKEELFMIQRQVTSEVLGIQARAGLEIVTDGQILWNDPVSHLLVPVSGIEIGQLMRFFDTNFYYRQPIIREKMSWRSPALLEEFLFARSVSDRQVKPVLTGPYTLARLSVDRSYNRFGLLAEAMCGVIAKEVLELSRAGATIIQIDEPAILQNPDDLGVMQELITEIAKVKGNAALALYTYFGDAADVYDKLQELQVDILGLDFTYSRTLTEVIVVQGTIKSLGLGIIDGRNTRRETEECVFPLLDSLVAACDVERLYLNPSCGLEYLPRTKAIAKLENMVRLRNKYIGGRHE